MTSKLQAVYFSDYPYEPAIMKGTKTEARKAGQLYIRQWGLDGVITRIETITEEQAEEIKKNL